MRMLQAADVEMIGYVKTKVAHQAVDGGWVQTGVRSLEETKADVDKWAKGEFAPFVRGIFFDEVSGATLSPADEAGALKFAGVEKTPCSACPWSWPPCEACAEYNAACRTFVDAHYLGLFKHARTYAAAATGAPLQVVTNHGGTIPLALADGSTTSDGTLVDGADIAVIFEHPYWFFDPDAAAGSGQEAPAPQPKNDRGGCLGTLWSETPPLGEAVYGPGPFCPFMPVWDSIEVATIAADPNTSTRTKLLRLAALVYDTPTGMDVGEAVRLARESHLDAAGKEVACTTQGHRCPGRTSYIYLTDTQVPTAYPWGGLPSYWCKLLEALEEGEQFSECK